MVVERKLDCCNRFYYEFNGSSHLYFINGYVHNGIMNIYIGSKVILNCIDKLYNVLDLCKKNFKIVKLKVDRSVYTFK